MELGTSTCLHREGHPKHVCRHVCLPLFTFNILVCLRIRNADDMLLYQVVLSPVRNLKNQKDSRSERIAVRTWS
ncbi:unnamed protein product [Amoebophrya sp. A25]|nr:unnamed protein product [Amoebophrya sp. A25]|eukprot:GSA25T00010745001.1